MSFATVFELQLEKKTNNKIYGVFRKGDVGDKKTKIIILILWT